MDDSEWFAKAVELDRASQYAGSLDIVFSRVDDMLCAGQFAEVDAWLSSIDVGQLSSTLVCGVLSITWPAEQRLKSRAEFYRKAWERLIELGRPPEKLIGNLGKRWVPFWKKAGLL